MSKMQHHGIAYAHTGKGGRMRSLMKTMLAVYNGGFFDKAMALRESMPKPVIAAISGTALSGAFEFALSCDLRIAEDGDYLNWVAGGRTRSPAGRWRHPKAAPYHRVGGRTLAHPHGSTAQSARG
jgi:enoyl-CoA hydratase/carnithine racemase